MTEKELKKLRRSDLLELLLDVTREKEQLQQELEQVRAQLESKTIAIESAGSLAEAVLQLNGVLEATQNACDQYTWNIHQRSSQQEAICDQMERETRERCDQLEQETQKRCDQMLRQAKEDAEEYWEYVRKKADALRAAKQEAEL